MSLTPTTRSTPQAALEIMYNITPLDLHLTDIGLKTYLRLKSQLHQPKHTINTQGHLSGGPKVCIILFKGKIGGLLFIYSTCFCYQNLQKTYSKKYILNTKNPDRGSNCMKKCNKLG